MKTKSWKTTGAGIGAIMVAVGSALTATFDSDPLTVADWGAVIASIIAGIGLIAARDNDKSSQDVGIR